MRQFGLLAVVAVFLFSCGSTSSQMQRQNFTNKEFNFNGSSYTPTEYYIDGDYFCTVDQNFVPDIDEFLDGRRFYQGCTSMTTASTVRFTGEPGQGTNLCFFPAIYLNGDVTVFADGGTGGVVHSCDSINRDDQVIFDFPGYEYNAGFVVDSAFELNMELCLYTDEAGLCPIFSFGEFFYPAN